ncbi:GPI transamidase subunit PIG-U [Zopfochytrium polystomum]|nr:GPI transamidase subunit PIG-U [Zopfochytrium polystomum]
MSGNTKRRSPPPSATLRARVPSLSGSLGAAIAGGIGARLVLLHFSPLAQIAANRIEVVTPVTSFKRLKEGLFLFENGVTPYEGGVYNQAPLLLALFHFLPLELSPYVFILVDALIAYFLAKLAALKSAVRDAEEWPTRSETGAKVLAESAAKARSVTVDGAGSNAGKTDETSAAVSGAAAAPTAEAAEGELEASDPTRPRDQAITPWLVAIAYLWSPYSVLACLAQSTLLFSHVGTVAAVYFSAKKNRVLGLMFLAASTYLSLYPAMLLIPCALLLSGGSKPSTSTVFSAVVLFVTFAAALLGLSYSLVRSWDFLDATYGFIIFVPDLTPNIGLYWYFFIEMFDQFRTFFLLVFQILAFIFSVPLTIRFGSHPLFITLSMVLIIAIFKSYPSVSDTALYIPFIVMHQELLKYTRNTYFVFMCLAYATVLSPLFYDLWIYAGSGNSNFFYAITLVIGLSQVILAIDITYAMVRREWERRNPELRRARVEIFHQ